MPVSKLAATAVSAITLGAALMVAPSASAAPYGTNDARAGCGYGYLCIWDGFSHTGNVLRFFNCEFVNIGSKYGWSDKLRSYVNNQTPGTVAKFYNWDGQKWVLLGSSRAYESIPIVNFSLRTTDAIQVC